MVRAAKKRAARPAAPGPGSEWTGERPPPASGTTIVVQQQQSQSGGRPPDQRVLIIALFLAAVPLFIGTVAWAGGTTEAAIILFVVGGTCAMTSIFLGFYAMWGYWSVPGFQAAKILAVVTLVLGMLSFGLFVVLPLIVLLFCRPPPQQECTCSCPDSEPCFCGCNCDCSPPVCDPCGCGGSGSSGGCGPCCGGSAESSDSGGGCCGSSSESTLTPTSGESTPGETTPGANVVIAGAGVAAAAALRSRTLLGRLRGGMLAHHPAGPAFRQDVFVAAGIRFCVGCFTVFPAFLLALPFESLAVAAVGWQAALMGGLGLAAVQSVSAAGWARWRWLKVLVKSCLGVGLAVFLFGVRAAPWPLLAQAAAVGAVLGLALLSTLPRRRRMAACYAPATAEKSAGSSSK